MFRRSDRHDDAPDERTQAARIAATQGFLALDDEQRAAADAVRAAEELDGTTAIRSIRAAWEQVSAACDRATEAYLAATQEFPLDGTGRVAGARAADERALRDIEAAREAIRRFRTSHSRTLDEATAALTALPQTVQEARVALVDARKAVQDADASGIRSRRAVDQLAQAEEVALQLEAAGSGLRQRRDLAKRTLDLARSAATLAAEAPRTAATARASLTSVATRRSAAITKTERIEPAMSALRREFSEPCSRDLVGSEQIAHDAIAAADAAISAATRHAEHGEWDDAADSIGAARAQLRKAEDRHDAVTERLAELRAVRTDPSKQATDTRFVLRDAQRLVVDRGLVKEFGAVLDAQSVRLANAQERLTGVHPDYWLYLTELRGVRERAKDVVAEVRKATAR
ncbi:hypothetical protein [Pseudonocardia sp. TRM90224]|uniref:hypothetical protein n=1 Tax=Pseudonocardia sp. TRM90224 TaxID=2812678 RepID=UPI001E2FE2E7|nr:hypothetical protein [Pseudonocardia sp. TRM90224]